MSGSGGAWRCTVCGYIHREPEPPGACPVCGAGVEAFEALAEEVRPEPVAAHAWRCLNCAYVHPGAAPPATCPVCGAPADRFQPADTSGRASLGATEALRVVVIGGGVAAVSAAEAVRNAAPGATITVLSREDVLPYYRLNLTRYLAGEVDANRLPLRPEPWYAEQRIDLRRGVEADRIDAASAEVVLRGRGRETIGYDRLILAAGAHPFVPPIPGIHREGMVALRTAADAERVLSAARTGQRVIVLGGGLLGLETAGAVVRQGAAAEVVEGFGWLLPRQLDRRGGEILAAHVAATGVALHLSAKVTEVTGDECVRGLQLEGGAEVEGDLLVVAAGVRPNTYLARQAGLEVNQGVVVDNHLRTSDARVWAAGDIAEHLGVVYGTWGPSQFQGSIAGMNAAGASVEFGGIPRSNTLKVLGVDMFSIGVVSIADASYEEIVHESAEGHYARFLFRDNALVGAILLGDTRLTATVTRLAEKRTDLSALLRTRPSGRDVVDALAGL